MAIQFNDNSAQVLSQMRANMTRALTAMGQVGLETVIDTMNTGYDRKIYQTGDLQRSMDYEIDVGEQSVTWGTNSDYGVYVHYGTGSNKNIGARPFLDDGILGKKDMLKEVAAEELKRGF